MIDHIVWYAANLEQGITELEGRLGVRATRGGTHTGLGTHNALLSLGDRCYFEIIAPDPNQSGGAWRDALLRAAHPGLFHWAVAIPRLETLAAASGNEFLRDRPVIAASRDSAALGKLSWKLLLPAGHPFGALIPFLIDWGSSPHPSQVLPQGCLLRSVSVHGTDKPRLESFFRELNLPVDMHQNEDPHFSIVLQTPRGEVSLDSIRPLPSGLAF